LRCGGAEIRFRHEREVSTGDIALKAKLLFALETRCAACFAFDCATEPGIEVRDPTV
jgi:hypothetical protein